MPTIVEYDIASFICSVIVVFPDHTHLLFLLYKFENRMPTIVEYDIASFVSSAIVVFPDHTLLLL